MVAAAAISLLLASCTGGRPPPASAGLIERGDIDLCEDYFIYHRQHPDPAQAATIKQEILRRGKIPESEWAAVDRGEILIGMTQCGALAAWGPPYSNEQTVSGGSQTIRLGYGNQTVVTDGNVVTAVR